LGSCLLTAGGRAFVQFLLSPMHSRHMRARRTISEVRYPQRIGPADLELAVDLVQRAWGLGVADDRHRRLSPPHASQSHGAHQPLHGALGHIDPFAAHLVPDLAGAIETKAVLVDALDRLAHLVIAPSTSRASAGIGTAGSVFVVGRPGDRQFAADRLDTQFFPVSVK
jgi:hypothetical protein